MDRWIEEAKQQAAEAAAKQADADEFGLDGDEAPVLLTKKKRREPAEWVSLGSEKEIEAAQQQPSRQPVRQLCFAFHSCVCMCMCVHVCTRPKVQICFSPCALCHFRPTILLLPFLPSLPPSFLPSLFLCLWLQICLLVSRKRRLFGAPYSFADAALSDTHEYPPATEYKVWVVRFQRHLLLLLPMVALHDVFLFRVTYGIDTLLL